MRVYMLNEQHKHRLNQGHLAQVIMSISSQTLFVSFAQPWITHFFVSICKMRIMGVPIRTIK